MSPLPSATAYRTTLPLQLRAAGGWGWRGGAVGARARGLGLASLVGAVWALCAGPCFLRLVLLRTGPPYRYSFTLLVAGVGEVAQWVLGHREQGPAR